MSGRSSVLFVADAGDDIIRRERNAELRIAPVLTEKTARCPGKPGLRLESSFC
ncbi:MAG: hypothetical protein ACI93T_004058 [Porticoccaceae bacterium]|jgi:hypothetical protein